MWKRRVVPTRRAGKQEGHEGRDGLPPTDSSTIKPVDAGNFTDKGPHRRRNEDVALGSLEQSIFIVADGLGGAAAGDRASRIGTDTFNDVLIDDSPAAAIVEKLLPKGETRTAIQAGILREQDSVDPAERLRFAFLMAHCRVLAEGRSSGHFGMATAMIAAWMRGGKWWLAHVGDCRAYCIKEGQLSLLTQDHSLSVALAGRRSLPKGAENSPFLRSRLTQVVGGESTPSPDIRSWQPVPGAKLFMCSDGVWGSLADEELYSLLDSDLSASEISRLLVEAAIEAGSRDNATALVVRF